VLRQEKSLNAAAKAAKISPERLRHFATEQGIIERQGRRWAVWHELPRRMLLFSDGRALQAVVGDFASASKVGRFVSAVSYFLRTNNPAGLPEFEGVRVADILAKTHVFETRPNALYRLHRSRSKLRVDLRHRHLRISNIEQLELNQERRKQRALERLATNNPRCPFCGWTIHCGLLPV
jgi:hypothetical protein